MRVLSGRYLLNRAFCNETWSALHHHVPEWHVKIGFWCHQGQDHSEGDYISRAAILLQLNVCSGGTLLLAGMSSQRTGLLCLTSRSQRRLEMSAWRLSSESLTHNAPKGDRRCVVPPLCLHSQGCIILSFCLSCPFC